MQEYSLVIASNFLDHYMMALSNELKKYFKDFYFVASEKLEDDYKKLGFSDLNEIDYVFKAYENKSEADKLIQNADIVITGSYRYQSHIRKRAKNNKPILYYSERLFKDNSSIGKLLRYIKYNYRHMYDKNNPLLCVSAYASGDYNSLGLFKDNTYKWGYFPEVKKYDINKLIQNKKKNSILWVGRLVEWKHPMYAIEVARKLKEMNYDFSMELIGTGELKETIENKVKEYQLEEYITLFNNGMAPEEVRKHMENSEIYLFTSDRAEGWGVVLNEALNSGCATVASYSAGSTPFLIDDNVNGMIYKNDNFNELFEKTKYLLDNNKDKFAYKAYESISEKWNCDISAQRIYEYSKQIINNKEFIPYEDGILSKTG